MGLPSILQEAIKGCELDLSDHVVLTEAASGAYAVTPVLAALAKAKHVYALTRSSAHGSVEEITAGTLSLANSLGVANQIEIVTEKSAEIVGQADIITNCGHVRPIHAEMIKRMKPTAVIPLMYEAWEFRPEDIDLKACLERKIPVAGTNETHPRVLVFPFLGPLAAHLLLKAGIKVDKSRILLLCNNRFASFIQRILLNCGASVDLLEEIPRNGSKKHYDALLVAMPPKSSLVIGSEEADRIADMFPETVVVQFLGDIDRNALSRNKISFWPLEAPKPGHMGIFLSDIGPEPVVFLQTGGLKVGQIMAAVRRAHPGPEGFQKAVDAAVESGYGQALPAESVS